MGLLALLLGCSGGPGDATPPKQAGRPAPKVVQTDGPDVVFVVLDTLRADALLQYGNALNTSPGLADFAKTATRFDAAYAPASWTVPSTTTILTGQHPLRHGMRHVGDKVPPSVVTLAERLKDAGWATRAYSHNISIAPKNGFDQGFDSFTKATGDILAYPDAHEITREIGDWLDADGGKRTFLYLQPMNCHGPYRVPKTRQDRLLGRAPAKGFRYYANPMADILKRGKLSARAKVDEKYLTSLREQYATAVRYATDEVAKIFKDLERRGRYDGALIVLTADHGEELFEHGGFSHGYSLHTEVLHVPLWIKLPGQTAPGVVTDRVSLADIVPTVVDALQLSTATETQPFDGRSLVPYTRGEALPAQPLLFDIDWGRRVVAQAVLDDRWKLVDIKRNYEGLRDVTRLYDVSVDPEEQQDLSAIEAARVADLRATIARLAASYSGGPAPENILSEMDHAQLEALGYLE